MAALRMEVCLPEDHYEDDITPIRPYSAEIQGNNTELGGQSKDKGGEVPVEYDDHANYFKNS